MERKKSIPKNSSVHRSRQLAVLQHALRYRIAVPEALALADPQLFPTVATAGRTCKTLRAEGLVFQDLLYHGKTYYFLSPAGAARIGVDPGQASEKPFSESAKIHALAFIGFCCLQGQHRTRLTAAEIEKHFRDLHRPGLPANYYVDATAQPPCIGFVRVDRGGSGRWDRIIAKVRIDIESHWLQPGFRQLIQRGRFELQIITSLPQKAERIRRSLTPDVIKRKVTIRVTAIPELINLIQPAPLTSIT